MAICKIGGLMLRHFSIVFNGTTATAAVRSHLRYETEELLSLQSMKDTTTCAYIFSEVLNAFDRFGLDLSTLCGIATDGARSMSGTGIGFVGLLKSASREKNISDDIAIFHCIIHQQNLCAKSLTSKHVVGPGHQGSKFYSSTRT